MTDAQGSLELQRQVMALGQEARSIRTAMRFGPPPTPEMKERARKRLAEITQELAALNLQLRGAQ